MSVKFSVIVADPPWNFSDLLRMSDVKRGADANYPTLTISEIKALPINDVAEPAGAVLALWIPGSLLQEGLDTMKAWGFNHKQTFVWVKTKKSPLISFKDIYTHFEKLGNWQWTVAGSLIKKCLDNFSLKDVLSFGMGRLFRQTHEICLIGTNNNKIYKKLKNKSQRSVCFGENLKHSSKPEDLQNSLEIMFPETKYLELFARRERKNWICLGNEICNGEDIRVSLKKLL